MQCLELYTACVLSQYQWDKAFHAFCRKISLSLQNNHWLSQTWSSLLKLSVQYSERGYVLWNISAVCGPHHHDPRFVFLSFFFKVILDPRFSITDPRSWFSSKPGSFTHCDYSFFFDHWRDHLFQSNQRFQAREFVDRPVPDKLDMGFLCSARGVASRVRDSQVQSYRYKHIRDTYVTLGWISTVPLLAPHINARKF